MLTLDKLRWLFFFFFEFIRYGTHKQSKNDDNDQGQYQSFFGPGAVAPLRAYILHGVIGFGDLSGRACYDLEKRKGQLLSLSSKAVR